MNPADELKEAHTALEASQSLANVQDATPFNPAMEVEGALVSLLIGQIDKIKDNSDYEDRLKEAVIARIPEASFSDLVDALSRVQLSNNATVEKILSPFIPRVGERIPLLDKPQEKSKTSEEDVFNSASKDMVSALQELSKVVVVLGEQKKQSEAEDIKAKLGLPSAQG